MISLCRPAKNDKKSSANKQNGHSRMSGSRFLENTRFLSTCVSNDRGQFVVACNGKEFENDRFQIHGNARTLSKIDFPYRPTIEDKCYCQQREWEIKTSAPGFQENT